MELQPLEEDLPRPEAEAGTDLEGGTASTEQGTLRHAGSGYTGQGGVKVKTMSALSCQLEDIFYKNISTIPAMALL